NSYTISLAIDAVVKAHADRQVDPAGATLVVIGASGNIGQTCAKILAPRYRRTILVGTNKPGAQRRLAELQARLQRAAISADCAAVLQGTTVVAATNAPEPYLSAQHFARDAIVCDISVPAAVRPEARMLRPDVLLLNGGIARLPFGEDHGIIG